MRNSSTPWHDHPLLVRTKSASFDSNFHADAYTRLLEMYTDWQIRVLLLHSVFYSEKKVSVWTLDDCSWLRCLWRYVCFVWAWPAYGALCRQQSTVKQTHCCEQSRKMSQINLTNSKRIKSKGIKRNHGESQRGFSSFPGSKQHRTRDVIEQWRFELCKGRPKHGVFTDSTDSSTQCISMYGTNLDNRIQVINIDQLVACQHVSTESSSPLPIIPMPSWQRVKLPHEPSHGSDIIGWGFSFTTPRCCGCYIIRR